MPKTIQDGGYYEFNRPIANYEIGRQITEAIAQMDVKFGRDVYTPRASDAKGLGKHVCKLPPEWHPAHRPRYFPHYYPGGSGNWGHIYYGVPGEDFKPKQP